jgi:hypothetical protein
MDLPNVTLKLGRVWSLSLCCRLTLTRLNVITVMVKTKLTTRTEDFLARLVWGSDHRENEVGYD